MSRALIIILAAVMALAVTIYVSSVAGRRIHRFLTIDQIQNQIVTDLPKGSAMAEADNYLTDNGVVHSLSPDKKTMGGIITWMICGLPMETAALISIHFGEDGRVDHIDVRAENTFL